VKGGELRVEFPKASVVGKIMPKEAFYKKLTISTDLKEKFITDIKKIVWQNKLSSATLNIDKGKSITEILVLYIELKKQELEYKIIETIARQNPHKILFVLLYENSAQFAIFHNKLYKSNWQNTEHLELNIKGLNLDDVWAGFVSQISNVPIERGQNLDEQLAKQEQIARLKRDIEKLEKQARSEKQPKRKFEMVQELQKLKEIIFF
jgi:hypothetical protein